MPQPADDPPLRVDEAAAQADPEPAAEPCADGGKRTPAALAPRLFELRPELRASAARLYAHMRAHPDLARQTDEELADLVVSEEFRPILLNYDGGRRQPR